MKEHILSFLHRALVACGFGPIVLAIVYAILYKCDVVEMISVNEMVLGILTITALAFIAGGITEIYRIEKLPLIFAILIHGGVLYLVYLVIYLTNGWLQSGWLPFLIFTACFLIGFALIWTVIYWITKKSTDKLNGKLQKVQGKS